MDLFTQGVLGAAAAQAVCGRRLGWKAAPVGFVAGLMPDADVFLTAFADPALPHELHRHFTHSLIFIPFGGLLTGLLFMGWPSLRREWKWTLAATMLAFATHAPLDACTPYGTLLLWPFSDEYVAWDCVSLIDPLFTVPLVVGTVLAMILKNRSPAAVMLALAVAYLGLGRAQHERAFDQAEKLAATRGHEVDHLRVMPTLGNLLVWRSVYRAGDRLHADSVHVPILGEPETVDGETAEVFGPAGLPQRHAASGRMWDVYDRFSRFADGFVARDPEDPSLILDVRYSVDHHTMEALWGLRLTPEDPKLPIRTEMLAHFSDDPTVVAWRNLYAALMQPPGARVVATTTPTGATAIAAE